MSVYVFSVYRNVLAFLTVLLPIYFRERNAWRQLTWRRIGCLVGMAILEPVMDQLLLYTGMQMVPASLSSAFGLMQSILVFTLSLACRLEQLNPRAWSSWVKVLGSLVAFAGVVFISISPFHAVIPVPRPRKQSIELLKLRDHKDLLTGAILCGFAVLCSSVNSILLAWTLSQYPAPLTITAGTCLLGAVIDFGVTRVLDGTDIGRWMLVLDMRLVSYFYAGIVSSALSTYLSSVVMRARGPVFVSAFSPLSMLVVMALGAIFLAEQVHVVSLVGSLVITGGMGLLLWGKYMEGRTQQQQQQQA